MHTSEATENKELTLEFVEEDYVSHNCYAVRLTFELFDNLKEEERYTSCVTFLKERSDRYFIVSEVGSETSKSHCQAWVDLGDRKVATFRKHLREFTRKHSSISKGNGIFSCKQTDSQLPIKYIAYLTKEDKTPIHNLSTKEMEKVAKRNQAFREERQAKIDAKKNQRSARQVILDEFYKDGKDVRGCVVNKRSILQTVINWYVVNDKCIRDFQIMSDARYLWLKLLKGHSEEYCDKLYANMDLYTN